MRNLIDVISGVTVFFIGAFGIWTGYKLAELTLVYLGKL